MGYNWIDLGKRKNIQVIGEIGIFSHFFFLFGNLGGKQVPTECISGKKGYCNVTSWDHSKEEQKIHCEIGHAHTYGERKNV